MDEKQRLDITITGEPDDDDILDDSTLVIRAKWSIDNTATLEEAAEMQEAFAAYLRSLADEGYELIQPVEDDYGHTRKGPPA